jgi:5'(3')-deoxyribonucleotidase
MGERLVVNIDMDGVIYDFNSRMTELGEIYLGRKLPVTEGWEMWEPWGVSKGDWYVMFNRAIRDGVFRDGHSIEGSVAAVKRLMAKHRVRIVTAKRLRSASSTLTAQMDTLRWLRAKGILNQVEVVFTSDKQGYPADVVIDDKPTLAWAQSGSLNLLFAQPWNRHVPEEAFFSEPLIVEVESWDDVETHVKYLSEFTSTHPAAIDLGAGRGGF